MGLFVFLYKKTTKSSKILTLFADSFELSRWKIRFITQIKWNTALDIRQIQLNHPGEHPLLRRLASLNPDWIHLSTSTEWMQHPEFIEELRKLCPRAVLSGFSSNRQLCDFGVEQNSLTLTAIRFKKAKLQQGVWSLDEAERTEEFVEQVSRHFDFIPETLMLLIPRNKMDVSPLMAAFNERWREVQWVGGGAGVTSSGGLSFVVCNRGFTDKHLQLIAFDKQVRVKEYSWPLLAKPPNSKEVGLLWFEGSTLDDVCDLALSAKEALSQLRETYAGHYLPMGFFTASPLGALTLMREKKEITQLNKGWVTTFDEVTE